MSGAKVTVTFAGQTRTAIAGPDGKWLVKLKPMRATAAQLKKFVLGDPREVVVPGGSRKINYDSLSRLGVGITHLGTSGAVAMGACAFALNELGKNN